MSVVKHLFHACRCKNLHCGFLGYDLAPVCCFGVFCFGIAIFWSFSGVVQFVAFVVRNFDSAFLCIFLFYFLF